MKSLDVNRLLDNIEQVAQYDLSNNKVFGSAYLVYQDGVMLEKCYGTISLSGNEKVTNTSIFRLASMTKPITAVAALILVERGLLSLDDTVDQYLPAFKDIKIQDMSGNAVAPQKMPTIRNVLSHASGIGSAPEKIALMRPEDRKTIDATIAFYLRNGLDFEPECTQWYSGSGAFDVLTKIIEIVSQMDYLSFLQKELFTPCEMRDTTFTPTPEQQSRMVAMHNRCDGENAVFQMQEGCIFESYPCTHYLGGAGLVSTLKDYGNFCKMLLNNGATETTRILQEETLKLLHTPQLLEGMSLKAKERWGLGVRVITGEDYPYLPIGCYGWSGAYGSHFWVDPENKLFAVYMKNSKFDGGAANESARNLEQVVYTSF